MFNKIFVYNTMPLFLKLKRYLVITAAIFAFATVINGNISTADAAVIAPNAAFTVNSKTYNLAQFRGRKVMLWIFSTWCPSCRIGLKILSDNQPQLKKFGLTVIALENYKDGGYSGPTAQEFAEKYGKSVIKAPNWLFGNASEKLAAIYNPKGYPDIYFLIDKKGFIRKITDAPAATINQIIDFAKGKKPHK